MVSMLNVETETSPGIDSNFANSQSKWKADIQSSNDMGWINHIPVCPTFYPTEEEFEDPLSYLESIAPAASKCGICKIVSPISPSVPAGVVLMKEKSGFKFTTRVQPLKVTDWDADDKSKYYMSGRKYSFREYEKIANRLFAHRFSTSANLPAKFVEQEFWKEITSGRTEFVEYACDVEGSAFSSSEDDPLGSSKWNLKDISRLTKSILYLLEASIPGVSEPMLYIGMLFSMFAWHVEDHYLYSINYHHCGASKTWYGVPGHAAPILENVALQYVFKGDAFTHEGADTAFNLLSGKTTMFPPGLLYEHGVPVYKAVQEPGDFIVTFPQAYHAGFSHGFNCGEAVNFALTDWFPFGAASCKRYRNLTKLQILPYEQLLCKEAMLLFTCDKIIDKQNQHFVKVSFIQLMKLQNYHCSSLKRKGAHIFYTPSYATNILCSTCNCWCFIAFCICQSNLHCMCLDHAMKCECGGLPTVYLRKDICKMEMVAHTFAQEDGILNDCVKVFPIIEDDFNGYVPFTELISTDSYSTSACLIDEGTEKSFEGTEHSKICFGAITNSKLNDMESASELIKAKRQCRTIFNQDRPDVKHAVSKSETFTFESSKVKEQGSTLSNKASLTQEAEQNSIEIHSNQKKVPFRIRLKIKGPSLPVKTA